MRCRLIMAMLAFLIIHYGCVSDDKADDFFNIEKQIEEVESVINVQHCRYGNYTNKDIHTHLVELKTISFSKKNCIDRIGDIMSYYKDGDNLHTPILCNLSIKSIHHDQILLEVMVVIGSEKGRLESRSKCKPFEDDYYIGWEVFPEGPQAAVQYNSKCDGTQVGKSGFQMVSNIMASDLEFRIPHDQYEYTFNTVDCFDLRFEDNRFSSNDYMAIVKNCIGKDVNDFRPEMCIPFFDLNCLYCELLPLIEQEVRDRVLAEDEMIAIFYFYFGYNSLQFDNNSIGYGLCYGYPEIVDTDDDVDSPTGKKIFTKGQ